MDRQSITDAVCETCVELLKADRAGLSENTHFADDLKADSLDVSEIVMSLEDQLDITIEDADLEGVATIGAAVDVVERVLAAAG